MNGPTQGATSTPLRTSSQGTATTATPTISAPNTNLCVSATLTQRTIGGRRPVLDLGDREIPPGTGNLGAVRLSRPGEVVEPAPGRRSRASLDPAELGHADPEPPGQRRGRGSPGSQRKQQLVVVAAR